MRVSAWQSVLWLVVFMVGCGGASGPELLDQGKAALNQKKYDDAITLLKQATEKTPKNAEAYNYLGAAYQGKGEQTLAVQAFEKSVGAHSNYPPARFNLGVMYYERGQFEKAAEHLGKFVALQPNNVEGFFYLASAQYQLEDLQDARVNYLEVIKGDPNRAEVLNNLGILSAKLGAPPREAETWFLSCMKTDPKYAPAYLNLAILYHRTMNKPAAALDYYEQFLALEPAGPASEPAKKAVAELKSAKSAAARGQESETKSTTPKAEEPKATAAEPDRQATSAPPRLAVATTNVAPVAPPTPAPGAKAETKEGTPLPTLTGPRYQKPVFEKPVPGKRDDALAEFNRGAQYQRDRMLDAAVFCYRQAIRLDPTLVAAYYNLGTALHSQGMVNQAIEAYQRTIALQPSFANARLNLAILFESKGYLADAAEQYEAILRDASTDASAHLALGRLYSKQIQTEPLARQHYQRFVELAPNTPDAKRLAQWLKENPR